MSLADELLADFGSDEELSDHESSSTSAVAAAPPPSKAKPSSSSGLMLPPSSLPSKRKALEDSLDDLAPPAASGSNFSNDLLDDSDEEMAEEGEGGIELPSGGVKPTEELDKSVVDKMDLKSVSEVGKVAKLLGSRKLEDVLKVSTREWGEGKRRKEGESSS